MFLLTSDNRRFKWYKMERVIPVSVVFTEKGKAVRLFQQWGMWVLLPLMLFSCSKREEVQGEMFESRSEEEVRLEKSGRLDSTLVQTMEYVDSVGWMADSMAMWRERLDGLSAEAWMMVEDSTGLLISAKNADERMFPASLTKMMTCLLTLEHGKMGDTVSITEDVFVTKDSRVRPGDGYEVGNLIREMMMLSDNVSAYALAKCVGGDTLRFFQMMNEKAAYLGMANTHFANANGMPNDSNYSTARDLLKLSRYSMCDPLFAEIVGTDSLNIPLIDGRHLPCKNTNALLTEYEGCRGVKTGYTKKAGACLASCATRNGVTIHLVLLKSRSYASRFAESAILLDYGFKVMEAYERHHLP